MKEKNINNKFLLLSLILFFLSLPILSIEAANYKAFLVEKVFGYDKLLITDGYSQYILDYNFECSSFDFDEGKTIWIDTYFSPGFFDTIIVETLFDTKTCKVSSSEEVNLKQYFVVSVIDNKDEVIVEDKYGDKYLVEYGIGCGLSFWRYEGKYIDIDIGGTFLDGIGDRIYLFDSDDDCKVWDAEELSSDYLSPSSPGSGGQYDYSELEALLGQLNKPSCPENSTYQDGKCKCNPGYVVSNLDKSKCVLISQYCRELYGANSYGVDSYDVGGQCYCKAGYEWNSSMTTCIKIIACPLNTTKINNECICNDGYEWNISKTDCMKIIVCPQNSSKIASECVCNEGYEWDFSRNNCIEKVAKISEGQTIQGEPEQQEEPEEIGQEKNATETEITTKNENKDNLNNQKEQNFLAAIFNAIKNFFSKIFHWFQ